MSALSQYHMSLRSFKNSSENPRVEKWSCGEKSHFGVKWFSSVKSSWADILYQLSGRQRSDDQPWYSCWRCVVRRRSDSQWVVISALHSQTYSTSCMSPVESSKPMCENTQMLSRWTLLGRADNIAVKNSGKCAVEYRNGEWERWDTNCSVFQQQSAVTLLYLIFMTPAIQTEDKLWLDFIQTFFLFFENMNSENGEKATKSVKRDQTCIVTL